ncbi:hypothetical protein SCB71_04945 [Herbiconiux sp. KACC 21604]|uniref:hypothetical protein n=1 Tax=unclassified Herbiconiux TaxID=2618217 RepID=UPI001C12316E|nr:hypothetical protein [Herbiconiux sp. SALV-R1]WPO87595.1 hypothetical protein SCB71_04945 [Herbiconiux sp. KACC 21604]
MRASGTVHAEPASQNNAPNYRVNFWQQARSSDWSLEAFVLTDVRDVREALEWVEAHRGGRRFELFVKVEVDAVESIETPRTGGLIRLVGENPNAGEPLAARHFTRELFADTAHPLPSSIPRGVDAYAPGEAQITVRHAQGYEAFVELVGEENALRMSAEDTLAFILSYASSICSSRDGLQRSAAIFLGNKVAAELPHAEWRAYGESGLEIAAEDASFDVVAAVRAACEGFGDPRGGLGRFLEMARGGEPQS